MQNRIPYNKPFHCKEELDYINDAFLRNHVSGNGYYTSMCQHFFEERYHFKRCFLTTSCTDALEMCAILLDIKEGDEIIMPSFTFVSTALAFVRQGARIRFIDSRADYPGMNEQEIENAITPRTRAIVVVHYSGIACDMDLIIEIANRNKLYVIEDAAQCVESFYKGRALGGIGHLGCISFHETKNIHCGEGGMLIVNDESFIKRADRIWQKGTNRTEYFKNEVNKYEWVDLGSSFLPSDILAAMLFAQLEKIGTVQQRRVACWNRYYRFFTQMKNKAGIEIPSVPDYATNNGHLFWILVKDSKERDCLIEYLNSRSVHAVFHYQSLHNSSYYKAHEKETIYLPNAEKYSNRLIRLPLYFTLTDEEVDYICMSVEQYFLCN